MSEGRRGSIVAALRVVAGQLAVIISGVLIALWVDEIRQDRADRSEELVLIEVLRDEYVENRLQLDVQMGYYERRWLAQSTLLELGPVAQELGSDSVNTLWMWALRPGTYDPGDGALTTVLTSGDLSLLRDVELRKLLARWQSALDNFGDAETQHNDLAFEFVAWLRETTVVPPSLGEVSGYTPEADADYSVVLAELRTKNCLRSLIGYWGFIKVVSDGAYELLDTTVAHLDHSLTR